MPKRHKRENEKCRTGNGKKEGKLQGKETVSWIQNLNKGNQEKRGIKTLAHSKDRALNAKARAFRGNETETFRIQKKENSTKRNRQNARVRLHQRRIEVLKLKTRPQREDRARAGALFIPWVELFNPGCSTDKATDLFRYPPPSRDEGSASSPSPTSRTQRLRSPSSRSDSAAPTSTEDLIRDRPLVSGNPRNSAKRQKRCLAPRML
ncbi:uncharacterized protein DS421_7g211320 [Arachis hypogaea]|nr:uncharacterized protein DS421_7g211320 [Arachis hypogaea]